MNPSSRSHAGLSRRPLGVKPRQNSALAPIRHPSTHAESAWPLLQRRNCLTTLTIYISMSDMADKKQALQDLGKRFRTLRKSLHTTQTSLAKRARVSRDTIHRLECGEVVDLSSLTALVSALGYRVTFEQQPALRARDMRRLFPDVHEEADQ